MKAQALLALAIPAVLSTPAPLPGDAGSIIAKRDPDTSCNPYTDWGHTQGTQTYFCNNFAEWWETPDYHCVSYKSADFCSGKIFCSDTQTCSGNDICRYGICLKKVNGKQCQRTCTY